MGLGAGLVAACDTGRCDGGAEPRPWHGASEGLHPQGAGVCTGSWSPGSVGGCCFPFPTTSTESWRGSRCRILPLHWLQSSVLAAIISKLMGIPFPRRSV